jgi:prevent-host-death family protein
MTTVPLVEAKTHLSRLVDSASTTRERITVTKNGRRAAVILGAEDYDSLLETLDILSDPATMRDLAEADRDMAAGKTVPASQVVDELRAAGRL